MTKRTAVSALFLLIATQAFASTTGRYVVGLKSGVNAGRGAGFVRDIESAPRTRDMAMFSTVNAFAANLTPEEAAELRQASDVNYVEPIIERHALGLTPGGDEIRNLTGQTVPFGIDLVRAREVWSATRGARINVVVIDTGVDYNHPDLQPAWAGGYNAVAKNDNPLDDNGHGTHVAGTIAAADNGFGVVGVAPGVRLWSVKVLKADGKGSTDLVVAAVDWVIKKKRELGGDWILNLSLGSDTPSIAERSAFRRAVDEGLLVVAASGNESEAGSPAPVGYPAAYPGVMAIGAIDAQKRIASFSNQGAELAVVAPGVGVLSSIRVGTGSISAIQTDSGLYAASELTGSRKGSVTGEFVLCGLGSTADFPASVYGRIAMINRGSIPFAEKTRNAKNAGAIAVVIVNNDTSALSFTLINADDPETSSFDWPVTIAVSKADGEALLSHRGTITVTNQKDDYGTLSGTSMATPHAAGVAALVWGADPGATAINVQQAMTSTAVDLGAAGFDSVYGNGMLDSLAAAKQLAPATFAVPSIPSGRRILRRGR